MRILVPHTVNWVITEHIRNSIVRGSYFFDELLAGALSAIHRWCFAMALCTREPDAASHRLVQALNSFYKSTCEIADAENVLAENVVNREKEAGLLRLNVYGALMRSYLYLAEKNDTAYF